MKREKTLWFVLLVFFNTSCNWCRVECDVFPGVSVSFELLNAINENLLEIGELDQESIHLTMGSSNDPQPVYFSGNAVVISFLDGEELYTLVAGDASLDITALINKDDDGDCCASYSLKKLTVDGVEVTPKDGLVTIHL